MTNQFWLFVTIGIMLSAIMVGEAAPQATVSTGSIQGTITDPTGAVIPNAKVTITNAATGRVSTTQVTSTGSYSLGALLPGDYTVTVEAAGFKTAGILVTVQVGVAGTANVRLRLGSGNETVEVQDTASEVNTEQATVQGVLTSKMIEALPINGRNFLDSAQLEPGVQIQDGGNFDPTKNGFSSISFGGRNGRTARIEVDGLDISDENVGTTTQNIPQSAIQEFQISQSSLDLSTELTSSGAVNVVTRSGSNSFHGQGFYYGRNDSTSARIAPTTQPFLRHQYGASLGGPLLKNRLFFFGDFERTRQDLSDPVTLPAPFSALSGSFTSPFRDLEFLGRLDWEISAKYHVFYRFSYEQNNSIRGFIPNTYNPFKTVNHTPVQAVGLTFTTGSFTHSLRAGYTKYRNQLTDGVLGSNIFNPGGNVALAIGGDPFCLTGGADFFCSGPNFLAPQQKIQSDKQIKYDGSTPLHSHIIRFGIGVNRILAGGFTKFVGTAPIAFSGGANICQGANCPGPSQGAANPLNYSLDFLSLGNGQGFSTEIPQFGLPAGGQYDTRLQLYVGDVWRIKPNITLSYGLRYVRDTGRTDSDLPPIPVLNEFGPGLGNRVNQPNLNFGPNVGLAWDPTKSGKTVIRLGGGLFYENSIFGDSQVERPARLPKGLFLAFAAPCPGGSLTVPGNPNPITTINGHDIATQVCNQPIGNVLADVSALEQLYQSATSQAGPQKNPVYIANSLAEGFNSTGNNLFAPTYRSPRSWQTNVGVQRQLWSGTVLSVDYLRNVGLHYLLISDTNHVGDARYLKVGNAQAAMATTNNSFGCGNSFSAASVDCAISHGATISSYAANGLDSGNAFASGFACPLCAFPGINQDLGQNQMSFSGGRSVYNGLQIKLVSNVTKSMRGLKSASYQIAYSLSRFVSQTGDQDFVNIAPDFANPSRFSGPSGLDRKHQFSAGAVLGFPWATQVSFTTHWYSPLPQTLYLPTPPSNTAAIFTSDLTGDGTFGGDTRGFQGDVLAGTNLGSFGRNVSAGDLNKVIASYNTNVAGTITPAGAALVNARLFTKAQLTSLGAVAPAIALAPPGAVGLDQFFTFDLRLGWVLHPKWLIKSMPERVTVEPQIEFFNLFNRQNFDAPSQPLSGILSSFAACTPVTAPTCPRGTTVNNTTDATRTNLTTIGSGVFALGAPRQLEWGVKVSF